MEFVDGQRRMMILSRSPAAHPLLVVPCKRLGLYHDGSISRRTFGLPGHGVGFQRQNAVFAEYFVFVVSAGSHPGNKNFPDACGVAQTHEVSTSVPLVEITYHGDPAGVGCPHRKPHTGNTIHRVNMGTERAVGLVMFALSEEMQIHITENRPDGVGVLGVLLTVFPANTQGVGLTPFETADKKVTVMPNRFKLAEHFSVAVQCLH